MKRKSTSHLISEQNSARGPIVAEEVSPAFSGHSETVAASEVSECIRIMILDDQLVIREALCMLIATQKDMKIVAEAGNIPEALKTVQREKPDVLLLDLNSGGAETIDHIPELILASGETRVLALTDTHNNALHRRTIRLGATGLMLKNQAASTLFKAIRKISAGEAWIDRSLTASLLREMSGRKNGDGTDSQAAQIAALTRREREVITVLCEGCTNRRMADRLSISEVTVRNHITSILSKLNLSDRLELAIYCYRQGLAKPPI